MTEHFEFRILDKKPLGDFDDVLQDGHSLNHRLMLKDSISKTEVQIALDATEAVKVRDAQILAATRRPGFVYDTTLDSQASARASARQTSYDLYDKEISTAYLGKAAPVTDAIDPRTQQYDAASARAEKEKAYLAYDADLAARYRK